MRPVFLNLMWSSNTLAVVLKRFVCDVFVVLQQCTLAVEQWQDCDDRLC